MSNIAFASLVSVVTTVTAFNRNLCSIITEFMNFKYFSEKMLRLIFQTCYIYRDIKAKLLHIYK